MHSWSNLPNDLLSIIGEHLDTRIDVLRFRAVCASWRSSIPHPHKSSPLFPMKLPYPIDPIPGLHPAYFTLTESTVYRFEPPDEIKNTFQYFGGWLVKAEEFEPGKFRLLNPLSRHRIRYNPKKFPKKLNLLDYHVFELSKAYKLEHVHHNYSFFAEKTIFSAEHSAVLVIYKVGSLALWRVGDEKWTQLHETCDANYRDQLDETCDANHMDQLDETCDANYTDIMLYKGQFHAIDDMGTLVVINSSTLKITKVSHGLNNTVTGTKKHLLQSSGDLYVVERHLKKNARVAHFREKTVDFDIYKLNEVEHDWVKVKTLEDHVMFLGDDCSFSSLAEELARCRTNFIYFADKMAFCYRSKGDGDIFKELEGHDTAMFNLEDRSICGIATGPRNFRVIWPPPIWLKLN